MEAKITENAQNDQNLGKSKTFEAKMQQNSGNCDTPSAIPTISEDENIQEPSVEGEEPQSEQKPLQGEQNQDFFDKLTLFLQDFLAKQGISSQRGEKITDLSVNELNNQEIIDNSGKNKSLTSNSPLSPSDFSDYLSFTEKYPNVSLQELEKDQSFSVFLQGREKSSSFEDIYKSFTALTQIIEKEAIERHLAKLAQEKSSVGSLSSPNKAEVGFFTKDQVLKMSKEQITRNYDKIRRSQQSW